MECKFIKIEKECHLYIFVDNKTEEVDYQDLSRILQQIHIMS